jgi:hypothetical protein
MKKNMTQQEKIDQAVKQKQKRYDQTSASILVSWATNCAVEIASKKDLDREMMENEIISWRGWFIDSYRSWMLENGPIEPDITELGNKWQENYNERSETEKINEELQAIDAEDIPF